MGERKRSTLEIAREMTPRISSLPGVTAFPITPPSLGQGLSRAAAELLSSTSDSYQNLAQVVRHFKDEMAQNPGFLSAWWTCA